MGTYRVDRSYRWNYDHGPQGLEVPPKVPQTPMKDFCGFRVRSRSGVAAGLLLNSRWVEAYARRGFDILTYKTVRSARRPCYPLPNWLFVEAEGGLDVERDQILRPIRRPRDPAKTTSAVCFGMPSMDPALWRRDVAKAKAALSRGQLLIVSVVGTPRPDGGEESLVEDFVRCAVWAAEAGADIVEANYSCPNVCTPEGSVYQDEAAARRLSEALRVALPSTPFFIKSGHFDRERDLNAFFDAVGSHADGVVLVNGVSRRVRHADGRPAFGDFDRVGILGSEIHEAAVRAVGRAVRAVRRSGSSVEIVGVGGVMDVEGAGRFFDAGASAVVMGGSPMLDPDLAIKMKSAHPEW